MGWVGNELVPRMKTDGSAAPAPLGDQHHEVADAATEVSVVVVVGRPLATII